MRCSTVYASSASVGREPPSASARTPVPRVDAAVRPWRWNPSSWPHRVSIAALAAVAFVIASYMGLYQLGLIRDVWDPVFGDQSRRVLDSDLSELMSRWLRVGDAVFGALAYLGDIVFALAGSTRRWQYRPWLVVVFGIDVIPLGLVSALLVVAQGAVVGAWCLLCLVTAVISLVLIVLAYDEVWSSLKFLGRVWRLSGGDVATFWNTVWGRPSELAYRAGHELARERGG